MDSLNRFKKYNLFLIFYTVFVILWGAWVRISKSGDGCGDHWPLCHGAVIPKATSIHTWVEFTHRVTTGLYGIFIVVLLIWGLKLFKKGHAIRTFLWLTFIFMIIESLIGAVLVKLGLVAENESLARAYVMALHTVNSLLLSGSLMLTYDFSKAENWYWRAHLGFKRRYKYLLLTLFLFVAATGALASLSGTLFPSESLAAGLLKDFSRDSHILVRLRVSHPIVATVSVMIFLSFVYVVKQFTGRQEVRVAAQRLLYFLFAAMLLGYMTLFLLSPLLLKLSHLAMAHVLWMMFVSFIVMLGVHSFEPQKATQG